MLKNPSFFCRDCFSKVLFSHKAVSLSVFPQRHLFVGALSRVRPGEGRTPAKTPGGKEVLGTDGTRSSQPGKRPTRAPPPMAAPQPACLPCYVSKPTHHTKGPGGTLTMPFPRTHRISSGASCCPGGKPRPSDQPGLHSGPQTSPGAHAGPSLTTQATVSPLGFPGTGEDPTSEPSLLLFPLPGRLPARPPPARHTCLLARGLGRCCPPRPLTFPGFLSPKLPDERSKSEVRNQSIKQYTRE